MNNKWGEENFFTDSRIPTNKCRRNEGIRKSSFGNHDSNNSSH